MNVGVALLQEEGDLLLGLVVEPNSSEHILPKQPLFGCDSTRWICMP